MSHLKAEKYARNLSLAGGRWRLPTRDELKSLYDLVKPAAVAQEFCRFTTDSHQIAAQGDHARLPHDGDKPPDQRRFHPLNPPGRQRLNLSGSYSPKLASNGGKLLTGDTPQLAAGRFIVHGILLPLVKAVGVRLCYTISGKAEGINL
jgi:hypothetical protein